VALWRCAGERRGGLDKTRGLIVWAGRSERKLRCLLVEAGVRQLQLERREEIKQCPSCCTRMCVWKSLMTCLFFSTTGIAVQSGSIVEDKTI